MANGDEDVNLVSQVIIEGIDTAQAQLAKYGDAGKAAWDKIASAAKASGAVVARATAAASDGISAIQKQFARIGTMQFISKENAAAIKDIGKEFEKFGASLGRTTQAVGRFSQRFALLATAGVAAGVALTAAAGRIAKEVDGTSDALDKQTKAQQDANQAQGDARIRAINFQSTLRGLQGQLARGEISFTDYSAAVNSAIREEREQVRVAAQVKAVQDDVTEANERLAKSLADRKAYQALVDTFGGPLTSSLVAFGRQVNAIRQQIITAFGPGVSTLIDAISSTLTANGAAISKYFGEVGNMLAKLATQNAPELREALENLGAAAGAVFRGLIAAAPSLLKIFNDGLVPAVKFLASLFDSLAAGINKVFGTQLTGGTLAAVAAFAQFSGLLRLLPRLLGSLIPLVIGLGKAMWLLWRNSTPVGIAITALIAVIGLLYAKSPAFRKFADEGRKSFGLLVSSLTATAGRIVAFVLNIGTTLSGAWTSITSGASTAVTGIQDVFGTVGAFFTGLWTTITTAASDAWTAITAMATAAYEGIVAAWNGTIAFFAGLWTAIQLGASTVWNFITLGVQGATAAVIAAWTAVGTFLSGLWETITTAAAGVWTSITEGVTAATKIITDAWQAVVDFLAGIWTAITEGARQVWDGIVQGFNDAINSVTGYFQRLLNAALQYLQPIIDMLKLIISLGGGSASAASSSGAVSRAGGGVVRGPGTSTSDSIPAWLSDNEFVVRAKAVRKYGQSFLNAVNRGTFNPDSIARFASGGLVNAMSAMGGRPPAYASADRAVRNGSAGTGPRNVLNLTLDGEQFNGLLAPAEVADKLRSHAIKKKATSAGTRPLWQR